MKVYRSHTQREPREFRERKKKKALLPLGSRLQVENNGHKLPAIHYGFKSSFGAAHTMVARDNLWPGAKVRGQHPTLRAERDGARVAMMDGGNLQLLIAPKELLCDCSPSPHTHGERGRTEAKARGPVSKIGVN